MQLAYRIDGLADGKAVVFLGSLGSTTELWQPQIDELGKRFRLIRLDLPGHGLSPPRPAPFDIADIAADVIETTDALGLSRFAFVGLSIGGMVGQWLGAHRPDRLERLAILFSAARVPSPRQFMERAAAVRAAGSTGHLTGTLLPRWFTAPFRDNHSTLMQSVVRMVSGISPAGYASCAEALARADLREAATSIRLPALIVGGAKDGALPLSCSDELARLIPAARYVVLPDGAHLASIECAAKVNRSLAAFFDENGSSSGGRDGK